MHKNRWQVLRNMMLCKGNFPVLMILQIRQPSALFIVHHICNFNGPVRENYQNEKKIFKNVTLATLKHRNLILEKLLNKILWFPPSPPHLASCNANNLRQTQNNTSRNGRALPGTEKPDTQWPNVPGSVVLAAQRA